MWRNGKAATVYFFEMHAYGRVIAAISSVLSVGLVTGACATSPRSAPPAAADSSNARPDACLIVPRPNAVSDSIVIVLEENGLQWRQMRINIDSSSVLTPFEMRTFAVAQIFETMFKVDCEGRLLSALAERWSAVDSLRPESGGFTAIIRGGARFANGLSVTGDIVAASIRSRLSPTKAAASGQVVTLGPIESSTTPSPFANLSFHVAASSAGAVPQGSGQFQIDSIATRLGWTVLRPAPGVVAPTLHVRSDAGADARDMIDRGVHVLQTRDPAAIDYARRANLSVYSMPWDRTYVMAIPRRGSRVDSSAFDPGNAPANSFRASLAREAVRGEARGAQQPAWWQSNSCLPPFSSLPAFPDSRRRVVYDPSDPIARSIAERLVALVNAGISSPENASVREMVQLLPEFHPSLGRVTAYPSSASFRSWDELAYIMTVPQRTSSACSVQAEVARRAPSATVAALIPLIDSRPFLIARSDAPAMSVDWDGILRVHIRREPPVRRQ